MINLLKKLILFFFINYINSNSTKMKQTLITDFLPVKSGKKNMKITDFFKPVISNKEPKVYGYNCKTHSWHCTQCGEDMGEHNPRQLCRKTYCGNE